MNIEFPEIDAVDTKTAVFNYFNDLLKAFRKVALYLVTETGLLKSKLKAQDAIQGTNHAARCVRALVWVSFVPLFAIQRAIARTATLVYGSYAPENQPKPKPKPIDWNR